MTAKLSATARAWFAAQGKIGGASATGAKKLRGDRAYYAELGRKAAAARKLKKLNLYIDEAGQEWPFEINPPSPKGH